MALVSPTYAELDCLDTLRVTFSLMGWEIHLFLNKNKNNKFANWRKHNKILLDWPTPQSYQEATAATGSPRDTVNGFRPLFRPNNYDPVFTADAIRNSLPPGFKFSSASSVMTPNSYPSLSAPAIDFTSPRQGRN